MIGSINGLLNPNEELFCVKYANFKRITSNVVYPNLFRIIPAILPACEQLSTSVLLTIYILKQLLIKRLFPLHNKLQHKPLYYAKKNRSSLTRSWNLVLRNYVVPGHRNNYVKKGNVHWLINRKEKRIESDLLLSYVTCANFFSLLLIPLTIFIFRFFVF